MTINGRIVLLRQRLGLSQRVFGERISRSVAYVSKVESGRINPPEEVVDSICAAFGVGRDWLVSGNGKLEVESVGDRIRLVRKRRDYTQEELAEEIGVSRNSVGMIERGTFRPGRGIVDAICDKLWVDRNWLLTGQGTMERSELTEIYSLLRQDPEARRHIRSFIDHLDAVSRCAARSVDSRDELVKQESEDRWVTTYVVNDIKQGRKFFKAYNIAFREIADADGNVRLKVKAPRDVDQERAYEIRKCLEKARMECLCDHEFVWRDEAGNTVITYSPYDVEEVKQTWIEKVENNFYGFGTTTFAVKCG